MSTTIAGKATEQKSMNDQYDYIIVGAGSSGCVIANRLSADPAVSVLLVEAGPSDQNPLVRMPRGIGKLFGEDSKFIWNYQAHTGGNRPAERWFKGKLLGGSSSVNGMVYMRGSPRDFDRWEEMGCSGWSWNVIGTKYKELEDHELGEAEWRGVGGPLRVTVHPKGDPFHEAIIAAAGEMGIPRVADINDAEAVQSGCIGYQPRTIWRGKRFSAADAFLKPVLDRPNLEIVTDSRVLQIEFDGQNTTGIRVRLGSGERSIRAGREVILSCGAIETPKLLQLSGIGPSGLLRSFSIAPIVDSPDVGQNLLEHRHFDIKYRVTGGSENQKLGGLSVVWQMLKYIFMAKGPMTHAAHEVGGYMKTDPALDYPDMQFNLFCVSTSVSPADGALALDSFPGITLLGYQSRPESKGEVRIQSSDPDVPPYINANHLDAEIDRKAAVGVVKWMRRLSQQPALAKWVVEESAPGPAVATDEDILAHAMEFSGTAYHICGTARMGADAGSVVDPQLRVRGVTGLRVADTSIMPTIVSANTNAPAMVIGLRAAELILEDRAG
jgi:choline dehydrogenase